MLLSGGAVAKNIVWVVADDVTAQAGAHVEGIILGATAVTLVTGSSMNGRILTQTAVALQQATVVEPS
jgi:Ice-binding-like